MYREFQAECRYRFARKQLSTKPPEHYRWILSQSPWKINSLLESRWSGPPEGGTSWSQSLSEEALLGSEGLGFAGKVLMVLTPLTGGSGWLSGSAWGLLRWEQRGVEYPEGDTWPVTARNLKKRTQTLQWCYSIFGNLLSLCTRASLTFSCDPLQFISRSLSLWSCGLLKLKTFARHFNTVNQFHPF